MGFYLVFSEQIHVIMLRLTITQTLCTIIMIIKQVHPSSKIIVIFKAIIIKVYPTLLNIYHFIIHDDPVLSTSVRFLFFSKIVECCHRHLEFTKLKKGLMVPFS